MSRLRKPNTPAPPTPGWAVYLRTSSDENQKPELSRERQRFAIEQSVLAHSDMPVIEEYVDVLTGKDPRRKAYQQMLMDARAGKFSHVIVERADRFGRNDTEALRAIDELDQYGVAVRFANAPDLDPMDPDGRVVVALSFILAQRESTLMGIRVKTGMKAKRMSGGFAGRAPDGYVNMRGQTAPDQRSEMGRMSFWIEPDLQQASVWREAWNLLLTGRMNLAEIAEALHAKGYRDRNGKPFVLVSQTGHRKPLVGKLRRAFQDWTYAGWVVSEIDGIEPKTIRGNWEPIVTTEEFERGLEILERRNRHRIAKRRHDYLLKGSIFYIGEDGNEVKLTGSTSNTYRRGGGTAYYCIPRSNINFKCDGIDRQIPDELKRIQVDPDMLPMIRAYYTHDLAEKLGHNRPSEREQLVAALEAIDQEEARTVRLLATGKISEDLWNSLWAEWQDRRLKLRATLEGMTQQQQYHIENLESALGIIAQVGTLYNRLDRSAQKELLHHMVKRVVVNVDGEIVLELRAPFAYLKDLLDRARREREGTPEMQTSSALAGCSD